MRPKNKETTLALWTLCQKAQAPVYTAMSLQSHLVGVTANTLYFHNFSHGSAHAGEVSFIRRTMLCFVNISVPRILLAECQHFVSANFSWLWKELANNMGFRDIFCCSLLLDGIWYNTSSRPISIVGYVVTMQSNVWSNCCCHFQIMLHIISITIKVICLWTASSSTWICESF